MRGVALITALLVVALATIAATALMSTASLAIHRMESLRDTEEAWWVARGVEGWILGILRDDFNKSQYDGKDEAWAQPVDALPIDQGFLRGHVVDLQGRFNLNNLLVPVPATGIDIYGDQFQRLLKEVSVLDSKLEIPPGRALLGAIRDWADADQNQSYPEGAEDGVYASLDPPYRTANQPFTVVSELLAVHGMTPELYLALAGGRVNGVEIPGLVAALPVARVLPAAQQGTIAGTAINVNTAEEPVLISMSDNPNRQQVSDWIKERKDKPAQDKTKFNTNMIPGNVPYDVKTSYFQIQGEIFVGSSRVALYSLINRSSATPTVLAHSADAE